MSKAYESAVRFLTRREHSASELLQKLLHKGFEAESAREAIKRCQAYAFQSDARFAEMLCRSRLQQGYGPLRIRQELRHKGVENLLIEETLQHSADHWIDAAKTIGIKKGLTNDKYTLQKHKRLLYTRGFDSETIQAVVATFDY
jgi:regulatory protein